MLLYHGTRQVLIILSAYLVTRIMVIRRGYAILSQMHLVVQAWVLIQSFRIMDTRNLPFICLSYLEA